MVAFADSGLSGFFKSFSNMLAVKRRIKGLITAFTHKNIQTMFQKLLGPQKRKPESRQPSTEI